MVKLLVDCFDREYSLPSEEGKFLLGRGPRDRKYGVIIVPRLSSVSDEEFMVYYKLSRNHFIFENRKKGSLISSIGANLTKIDGSTLNSDEVRILNGSKISIEGLHGESPLIYTYYEK